MNDSYGIWPYFATDSSSRTEGGAESQASEIEKIGIGMIVACMVLSSIGAVCFRGTGLESAAETPWTKSSAILSTGDDAGVKVSPEGVNPIGPDWKYVSTLLPARGSSLSPWKTAITA